MFSFFAPPDEPRASTRASEREWNSLTLFRFDRSSATTRRFVGQSPRIALPFLKPLRWALTLIASGNPTTTVTFPQMRTSQATGQMATSFVLPGMTEVSIRIRHAVEYLPLLARRAAQINRLLGKGVCLRKRCLPCLTEEIQRLGKFSFVQDPRRSVNLHYMRCPVLALQMDVMHDMGSRDICALIGPYEIEGVTK